MVKVTRLSLLCFLENALAFISSVPRLILVKGSGHLLLLSYPVLLFLSFTFQLPKPKTPKHLLLSVCRLFLIQCHLPVPSAPRWDRQTLTYRKATIDPLALVGGGAVNREDIPTKPINFSAIRWLQHQWRQEDPGGYQAGSPR